MSFSWSKPAYNQYQFHVELSNVCNAACPICPRYWAGSRITRPGLTPTSISLEQFKKWFPPNVMEKTDRIMLCGNQGDPFAAKDIVEILEYCVDNLPADKQLVTHSNGGLRSEEVWKRAGKALSTSHQHYMWFSIDGLKNTNELYRRNVEWEKLMRNASAFIEAGGVAYWDMLVFKHNEHQIEEVRQLAKNMGFKNVRIKSPDGLVWDNKIQKRGVYDAQGKLEYYIEAAEDLQYVNAPVGMERNYEDPVASVGNPPDQWTEYVSNQHFVQYEDHNIKCKSLKKTGSEIMIQCDGLVMPCCYIGELWASGRQDDAKKQLQGMWDTEKLYLTKNKFENIMNYLDSTIMKSWNMTTYAQGKCMYCAKICGHDSPMDRLIHTKAGPGHDKISI